MTENARNYNVGSALLSPEAARWLAIVSVILAGFIAALHVGKAVNYLGQALGPVIVGTVVAGAGWSAAAIPVVVVAALGAVLGSLFKINEKGLNHAD